MCEREGEGESELERFRVRLIMTRRSHCSILRKYWICCPPTTTATTTTTIKTKPMTQKSTTKPWTPHFSYDGIQCTCISKHNSLFASWIVLSSIILKEKKTIWIFIIFKIQSVPGIVALVKWKTHAGKHKCVPGNTNKCW